MDGLRTGLLILICASVASSASQLVMRWGARNELHAPHATLAQAAWRSRWWLGGLVMSWFTGVAWALSVRHVPLPTAIPLYNGLIYLQTVIFGIVLLKEGLRPRELLGAALILAGIVVMLVMAKG